MSAFPSAYMLESLPVHLWGCLWISLSAHVRGWEYRLNSVDLAVLIWQCWSSCTSLSIFYYPACLDLSTSSWSYRPDVSTGSVDLVRAIWIVDLNWRLGLSTWTLNFDCRFKMSTWLCRHNCHGLLVFASMIRISYDSLSVFVCQPGCVVSEMFACRSANLDVSAHPPPRIFIHKAAPLAAHLLRGLSTNFFVYLSVCLRICSTYPCLVKQNLFLLSHASGFAATGHNFPTNQYFIGYLMFMYLSICLWQTVWETLYTIIPWSRI